MNRIPSYDYIYNFYKSSGCELLEDEYINNVTPMKFKCFCGEVSEKTWEYYRLSPRCIKCGDSLKRKNKNVLRGVAHTYEYVKNFIEVESESGCVLLSRSYTNNRTPLKMLCACGNEFSVSFQKFRAPNRKTRHCRDCSTLIRREKLAKSYQEVKGTIEGKGCKLKSKKYVNVRLPLSIICSCGEEYFASLDAFQGGQDRCAECSGRVSSYELETEEYLMQYGVSYQKEFKISECKDIRPLPFDFAVMDKNNNVEFLIEVDGQQHFHPVEAFGGEEIFVRQKKRDAIKDEFCRENDILLVRIPYYDIKDIDNYLKHLI